MAKTLKEVNDLFLPGGRFTDPDYEKSIRRLFYKTRAWFDELGEIQDATPGEWGPFFSSDADEGSIVAIPSTIPEQLSLDEMVESLIAASDSDSEDEDYEDEEEGEEDDGDYEDDISLVNSDEEAPSSNDEEAHDSSNSYSDSDSDD